MLQELKGIVEGMGKSKAKPELVALIERAETQGQAADPKRWAYAGVTLMAVMSAGLNGYANAQHATVPMAGWAMGIAIPAIVLILARVAGINWKAGRKAMAKAGAGVGIGLLVLSVWHCATSISLLTGSHVLLALPMALAIDAGLVYCECNTL